MLSLTEIDLSSNQLEGPLLDSKVFQASPFEAFTNNKGLCGKAAGLEACPSTTTSGTKGKNYVILDVFLVLGSLVLALIASGIIFVLYIRWTGRNNTNNRRERLTENLFAMWSYDGRMTYRNIIEETENFHPRHCVREGGHSRVYKAKLQTGQVFIVKRPNALDEGGLVDLKAFKSEIRALLEIRHCNIVKLMDFVHIHSIHSWFMISWKVEA